jgi:hypothetical protein
MFLTIGSRRTGQFLRRILDQPFPQLTVPTEAGTSSDRSICGILPAAEVLREARALSRRLLSPRLDCELQRILNRPPSSYVRIHPEFEYSFRSFIRKT